MRSAAARAAIWAVPLLRVQPRLRVLDEFCCVEGLAKWAGGCLPAGTALIEKRVRVSLRCVTGTALQNRSEQFHSAGAGPRCVTGTALQNRSEQFHSAGAGAKPDAGLINSIIRFLVYEI